MQTIGLKSYCSVGGYTLTAPKKFKSRLATGRGWVIMPVSRYPWVLSSLAGLVKPPYPVFLALCFALCAAPAYADDVSVAEPQWATALPRGGSANALGQLLVAVSGRPNSKQLDQLLTGVVAIRREQNQFVLERQDGAKLGFPRGTETGDRMFNCMEKTEADARARVGSEAGDFVRNLSSLTASGNHIVLSHSGATDVTVPIVSGSWLIPVHFKELRLKQIALTVDDSGGQPRVRDIDGIAAVVWAGALPLTVEPREFARSKDQQGNTHIDFGINSLVPPLARHILGLPDVVHCKFTIKKKR